MRNLLIAAVAGLMAAAPAAAATFFETQTQILTVNGQDMFFTFDGLAPSDGTGATVTIASGIATLFPGFGVDGLDLGPETNENFLLTFDAVVDDTYTCTGTPGTVIPGFEAPIDLSDCQFSLPVAIDGATFDGLIADGALIVGVLFGDEVDAFSDGDEVVVSLSYETAAAAIPLPATAWLMLAGLGGLAAMRRRAQGH